MFGLFSFNKSLKHATVVASEVSAVLQRHASIPDELPPPVVPAYPACRTAFISGTPPNAEWESVEVQGETQQIYVVPATEVQPSLALLSGAGDKKHLQVWELSDDHPALFVKQRPVMLNTAQKSWIYDYPVAVSCLPNQQVALAVGYHNPIPKEALYVYNPADNEFRFVQEVEPEMSSGPPFTSFETLAATPEAMLLLYHTGVIRLGAGNYAYEQDHIWLFSKRYPQGMEVIAIGIDDGNIRAWGMQNKVLWLQTRDKRKKPVDFIWSLDLGGVL